MTTIGFHARFTNPLTLGYYAYLACFDSWRKVADRVVVVDGGTTDRSVETLLNWIAHDPQVEVLNNALSHWGKDFAWEQSALNIQLGQEALSECDWIIRTDADHVVDLSTATQLRHELETQFSDQLAVAFDVFFFRNGKYHQRQTPRNWIINNRLAREKGIRIGWGEDLNRGSLSDNPLIVEHESTFVDPETQLVKPLVHGRPLPFGPICSLQVYRYGHFFFSKEQAIAKCKTWDDAVIRYKRKPPKSRLELMLEADVVGILSYMSRDTLLSFPHPLEMRRCIEAYYRPDILGAALYMPHVNLVVRGLQQLTRVEHFLLRRLTLNGRQQP